jgi:hypothetical protein
MTERAALLIRRRRPIGEPAEADPAASPHAALLHGASGAGRILQSLTELGVPLRDLVQSLHDPESTPADLDALDVGRLFSVVILGSHLVNSSDEALRRAFLHAARRHVDGEGDVLIEHHPLDWANTAEPTQATPGAEVGMRDVRRDPPFVSAVSVYDIGGRVVRQPFRARVLADSELEAHLGAAGLFVRRRLSPTWLQAAASEPRTPSASHRSRA